MAQLAPNQAVEKPPLLREKPSTNLEDLKQKPETGLAAEKVKNLEEARKMVISEIERTENLAPATVGPVAGLVAPQAKRQKQIESVLAEGLAEVYLNLAPDKRQEFKRLGEETAKKINQLMSKAKINIGKIIKLIRKWLALIPGVSKYFLEQEAKIKADEIMRMKN